MTRVHLRFYATIAAGALSSTLTILVMAAAAQDDALRSVSLGPLRMRDAAGLKS